MATALGGLMATALEFLNKERRSDAGKLMATTLGGLMATALSLLKENSSGGYAPGPLQDKRKEIEEALQGLMETTSQFLQEKLPWLIALWKSAVDFLVQKLEALYAGSLQDKRKEIEEALQGLMETTSQFLQEKLPWMIVPWKSAVDFLVQNLEALLPPGTSSDTVRFWVQLVMPPLLFLSLPILHYFLCGCFFLARFIMIACATASYWAIETTKAFSRVAWEKIKAVAGAAWETIKGGGGKMMKAPGRPGLHIPRAVFESDPGSYFRGLHANAPWQGARPNSKSKYWFIVGAGVVSAVVVLLTLL